jgi:hypothetical protein
MTYIVSAWVATLPGATATAQLATYDPGIDVAVFSPVVQLFPGWQLVSQLVTVDRTGKIRSTFLATKGTEPSTGMTFAFTVGENSDSRDLGLDPMLRRNLLEPANRPVGFTAGLPERWRACCTLIVLSNWDSLSAPAPLEEKPDPPLERLSELLRHAPFAYPPEIRNEAPLYGVASVIPLYFKRSTLIYGNASAWQATQIIDQAEKLPIQIFEEIFVNNDQRIDSVFVKIGFPSEFAGVNHHDP